MRARRGLILTIFEAWRSHRMARAVMAQYQSNAGNMLMLADIGARAGVFDHKPGDKSAYEAGVAEGRRALGLELLALMKAPDLFVLSDKLVREAEAAHKAKQRGR